MEKKRPGVTPDARETPVMVSVTGTDAGGDTIELKTRGTLTDTPGGWAILYAEAHPESLTATETVVECQENSVTVLRAGDVVSTIVYTEGEMFAGEYETPLGLFTLRVFATEVSVKRRGSMGHIRLGYQISLSSGLSQNGEMAMRWLDIRFRPCAV